MPDVSEATSARSGVARWVALLPFAAVVGAMLTADPSLGAAAVGWSAASLGAAALLVAQLGGAPARTLWAWLLLALFAVGYHLQTVLAITLDGDPGALRLSIGRDMMWVTPAVAADAYGYIAPAFIVTAIAATIALSVLARVERPAAASAARIDRRRLAWLLAGIGLISLMLAALRWVLDIGVLGRETQHLPWRVDTAIFRTQSHLLPALLIYALWASERLANRRFVLAAGALLFAHQLTVGLISTSKAGLLWFAMPVLFLWLLDGRLTRRRGLLIGVVLAAVILTYPVVTALRYARVQAPGVDSPDDFREAFVARLATQSPAFMARETARRLVVRVNGAAGVWFTLRAAPAAGGLDALWPDRGVPLVRYYTREIYDVTGPGDFRQPGLAAAFLIAGGPRGAMAMWVVFVAGAAAAWWASGRLRTAAASRALIGLHLLTFANEGTLQWQDVVAAAVCVLAVEGVHRRLVGPSGVLPIAPATAPEAA
jgi:hypothetical protein